MSKTTFELVLALMGATLGAALYAFAYSQAGPTARAWMALGVPWMFESSPAPRHKATRARPAPPLALERAIGYAHVAHVGATEYSPLLRQTAAFRPDPPVLHEDSRLDPDALAIIAAFDAHVRDWRTAPDYVLAWQRRVDQVCSSVGMEHEAHRRWRMTAWDWRTGSYPVLDGEPVTA